MEQLDKMMKSLFVESSIKDCAKGLNENKELSQTSMSCVNLLLDNNELVQVKIVITRNEDDFLGDFETEEMT